MSQLAQKMGMDRFDTFSPFPHLDLAWTATISFITPIDLPEPTVLSRATFMAEYPQCPQSFESFRNFKAVQLLTLFYDHGLDNFLTFLV